jgi:hypothetical protein
MGASRGIVDSDRGSLIEAILTVRRNVGPLRGILMFSILLTLDGKIRISLYRQRHAETTPYGRHLPECAEPKLIAAIMDDSVPAEAVADDVMTWYRQAVAV